MKFNNIMHVSFFTDQMDAMRDFYENKLGLKAKMIVRYEAYKNKEGHPWTKVAKERPLDICLIYIEIANGQFIELFPKADGQKEHPEYNQHLGYSHFSLTVDDIFKTNNQQYMETTRSTLYDEDDIPLQGHEALNDTMKDLMLDLAGAIGVACIEYVKLEKKQKSQKGTN